jgi:hypothetical protein
MNRACLLSVVFAACILRSQSAAAEIRQVAELTLPGSYEFGYSVAMSGNTVVVGTQGFDAYMFTNSEAGWKQAATLTGNNQDNTFASVAIGGNVVAVGSPDGNNGDGAVYVFVKPASGWKGKLAPTAELTIPPGVVDNLLGTSVAISSDGRTIVAGAPGDGGPSGAYVFEEPAGGWVNMTEPTAMLAASSGFEVGHSVAMSGNTIVAGEANTGNLEAAYVFVEPAGGWADTTEPNATLTASDEDSGDAFGYSVAISADIVVVGSPFHPFGTKPGAAYVFVEPQTGWADMTQTAELSVDLPYTLLLGESVAVEGNVVLAGAPVDPIGHNYGQGAMFGYLKPASGWASSSTPSGSVTASDGVVKERFGWSVSISGKNIAVGATMKGPGAVYIFEEQ